jgi:hypothetical protein
MGRLQLILELNIRRKRGKKCERPPGLLTLPESSECYYNIGIALTVEYRQAAAEEAVQRYILAGGSLCRIHQYVGPTQESDVPIAVDGWNIKPYGRHPSPPPTIDVPGYEVTRAEYQLKLYTLLRKVKEDATLKDSDIASPTFFPLPNKWSTGHWRNPWFPTLDNQTLPLDLPNFIDGMVQARNFYKWKNQSRLSALLDRMLHPGSNLSWPGTCLNYDWETVRKVENKLRSLTDRRSRELTEFVNGFHVAMLLFRIRQRWEGQTLCKGTIAEEMELTMRDLDHEYAAASSCFAFLQEQEEFQYHRIESVVDGSFFGRMQHICLLTEYAKALHENVYVKARMFEEGMCSWCVGWYDAPREAGSVLYDVLMNRSS